MKYVLFICLFAVGCTVVSRRDGEKSPTEVSLHDDKAELDKERQNLRKDVPPEVKAQNDDLAAILELMKSDTVQPSSLRARFFSLAERRRRDFRKETDSQRAQFNKSEAQKRKEFMRKQKEERTEFKEKADRYKYDRERTKEFYDQTEMKRRDYFDEERDRRKDFESEMRQKREDFNSRMRDWQLEFTDALRSYDERWKQKGARSEPTSKSVVPTDGFEQKSLESGQ